MKNLRVLRMYLTIALSCLSASAGAHEVPTAEIRIDSAKATAQVELDVVDLDYVIGIREANQSKLLVADVRRSAPRIEDYILGRISVDGCTLAPQGSMPGVRDGASPRVVLGFDMHCATAVSDRNVSSGLFDELPGYRTIVIVSTIHGAQTYPMQDGVATVDWFARDRAGAFLLFVSEGYRHIFAGFDHLLFLLLLVLPIVRSPSIRDSVIRAAGIVTAFTVAHSLTLALSSLGYLSLPADIVEPVIAGSIVVAAALNLVSSADRVWWPVAYLFGLIHGFGFAGAFAELAGGAALRWTDLLGFNLGVEAGQLAVTIAALVVLRFVSRSREAGRLLVPAGSVLVGAIGAAWFLERVF